MPISQHVAPLALAGPARVELTEADRAFGDAAEQISAHIDAAFARMMLAAARLAAQPTEDSARGVRHIARVSGLPVRPSRRESASERRDRETKARARALGIDGPSIAAQRMRGAA